MANNTIFSEQVKVFQKDNPQSLRKIGKLSRQFFSHRFNTLSTDIHSHSLTIYNEFSAMHIWFKCTRSSRRLPPPPSGVLMTNIASKNRMLPTELTKASHVKVPSNLGHNRPSPASRNIRCAEASYQHDG